MHFLTLSWDDRFRNSCLKIAKIFEKSGLRADFNSVATADLLDDAPPANMQDQKNPKLGWMITNSWPRRRGLVILEKRIPNPDFG